MTDTTSWRLAGTLVALATLLPIAAAQEAISIGDGRVSLAVPEPTFLPADAIAVMQIGGLARLSATVPALLKDALSVRELAGLTTLVERIILSQKGFPGIHPTRPFFVGIHDPTAIETEISAPGTWEDIISVGAFAVVAVPVADAGLFFGTLGTRLEFAAKTGRISRYVRRRSTFDFAGFCAAGARGELNELSEPEASAKFTKTELTAVFVVSAAGYALFTTHESIAAECALTDDLPRWRLLGPAPAGAVATGDVAPGSVVETGRIVRCQDDVALSIDVNALYRAHRDEFERAIGGLRRFFAAASSGDLGVAGGNENEARLMIGAYDMYADFVLAALRSIDTLEVSFEEHRGGAVLSCTLRALPGSELQPWLQASGNGERRNLVHALPANLTMAMGVDSRLDEPALRLYHDIAKRLMRLPGTSEDEAHVDAWITEAMEAARHCTGRMAMGFDIDGERGLCYAQIVELESADPKHVGLAHVLGPGAVWSRLITGSNVSVKVHAKPAEQVDGTRAEVVSIEIAANPRVQAATRPVEGADRLLSSMVSGLEIWSGMHDRFAVMVAAKDARARFSELVAALKTDDSENDRAGSRAAFAPFPGQSEMKGVINALDLLVLGVRSAASESRSPFGSRAALQGIDRLVARHPEAKLAFHADGSDGHYTVRLHIPADFIGACRDLATLARDAYAAALTEANIGELTRVLQGFKAVHQRFPSLEEGLDVLLDAEAPAACRIHELRASILLDGFGHPLRYRLDASGNPVITSFGKDGLAGGDAFDGDIAVTVP